MLSVAARAGQVSADDEKLILNLAERLIQLRVGQADPRHSQQRIQFVDIAVGDGPVVPLATERRSVYPLTRLPSTSEVSPASPLFV